METALDRLRLSKQKFEIGEEDRGMEEGKEWAMQYAEYADLQRIGNIPGHVLEHDGFSLGALLKLFEDESVDKEYFFGDEKNVSDARVTGFLKGVQNFWNDARSRL